MGINETREGTPAMTTTTTEIRRLANEAVALARRSHQQWHWDTRLTACPWGCGDGSGIADASDSVTS